MTASASSTSVDRLLAELLERATREIRAGRSLDVDALVADYPDQAEQLRQLLPAVQLLADLSNSVSQEDPASSFNLHPSSFSTEPLGDFRLIREVGRGGMGIVYEAEQLSLSRRVALKVLPLAATMDPRHLQRFRNEAQAAACLHHANIVPVYGVGCERGVHYYAMQLIEGQTLAQVIGEIQEEKKLNHRGTEDTEKKERTGPNSSLCSLCLCGKKSSFFRAIAKLIADAADALEYAHSMGVLHRDIKPGNLMLDNGGHLWITDFGLAKLASPGGNTGGELTLTGDLIGTLRYMSPEQALAKHGLVDHRTDIYSLGATLYELLTFKPAVAGADKAEILKAIAWDEPTPLRKHDKSIPGELETITLKCLAKEPGERYATAGEVAEDLRRWVEDKAIKAKPPTILDRAGKLAGRHPGVTAATGLIAGLLLASAWIWHRETTNAERAALAVAAEADQLCDADRLPEALQAARRAADLLPRFGGDATLRLSINERVADLQLLNRVEEARLQEAAETTVRLSYVPRRATQLFRQAWLDYGFDLIGGDESAILTILQHRPVVAQLAAAISEWDRIETDLAARARLGRLAEGLDSDPRQFVSRVRRAVIAKDVEGLKRMAAEAEADLPPPAILIRLAGGLQAGLATVEAERVLRIGQDRYPADFWVNHDLATVLRSRGPKHAAEAVRFGSVAVALRPHSPAAHNHLGVLYWESRRLVEAESAYRRALTLQPDFVWAHSNLGIVLAESNRLAEAEAAFRRALAFQPDLAMSHSNLGALLAKSNRLAEAEKHIKRAIALQPDSAEAHTELGNWYWRLNRLSEAEASYRKSIKLKPDNAVAHRNLGLVAVASNRPAEAEESFRQAIVINPDFAEAHCSLGATLANSNRLAEAQESLRQGITLKLDYAECHYNLGLLFANSNRPSEAEESFRRAITIKPDYAEAHFSRGRLMAKMNRLAEAEESLRRAIRFKHDYALAHCYLGDVLLQQCRFSEALAELRLGHELGSKQPNWNEPSGEFLRKAEQMVDLDAKLPSVLSGIAKVGDASEQIGFAEMCQDYKKMHAAAARFYADAFLADISLFEKLDSHRYNAACAAALAGCGHGNDAAKLDPDELARLRRQSLTWLAAEFDAWSKLADKPAEHPRIRQIMQHWQKDTDFAGVRDAAGLAKLPHAERVAWQKFWADVAELMKRCEEQPPATKLPTKP